MSSNLPSIETTWRSLLAYQDSSFIALCAVTKDVLFSKTGFFKFSFGVVVVGMFISSYLPSIETTWRSLLAYQDSSFIALCTVTKDVLFSNTGFFANSMCLEI